eukprot:CAMPEP_0184690410 /NCGR_PEP_ID=MMETSP0312-20130426/31212_1 /TAXON_ID=31354 /ORGANISM="Compsopogon coeruleus, Strain SAG 36.94" /LENGTH=431 /DNA_ID=CAMNT_0027147901 /DNA_START=4150 /DNA_END=5445 /DNA_ORIENTATION=-
MLRRVFVDGLRPWASTRGRCWAVSIPVAHLRTGIARRRIARQQQVVGSEPWSTTLGSEPRSTTLSSSGLLTAAAPLLSPSALVVTREYEWGNIIFGFEQANRYTIRATPDGRVVGYIAEEDSVAKSLTRNLFRTHRAFKATVLSPQGDPLFVVRRPFYFVSTSLFVESATGGDVFGEVHMNWHPWRRRYDLFVDKKQFARIDGGFLAVDFNMEDENGRLLASVNKDFTGLARELFTDARQYVVRMTPELDLFSDSNLGLPSMQDPAPVDPSPSTPMSSSLRLPDPPATQARSLTHDSEKGALAPPLPDLGFRERATALACAISIDFDYFSLHSHAGLGWAPLWMPFPVPMGGDEPSPGSSNDGPGSPSDSLPHPVTDASDHTPEPSAAAREEPSSLWAEFEEPDHGFEPPPDQSTSSSTIQDILSGFFGDE